MNVRPITPDDFPPIAAFLAEDETELFGRPSRVGVADVAAWLSSPDLSHDTWLFEEGAGLVALGWVDKYDDTGIAVGAVHSEWRGRGLGSELVELTESRLGALGAARIHNVTLAPDLAARSLLECRGYREVRRFWEMTIELGDDVPPDPVLPDGLRIESFSTELAEAFHAALEEAFADHWEHRPEPFEVWWQRQLAKPDHDPSLWFLVRSEELVVAATRNDPERSGGGWIGALGVRPAWRGRGLAKALLLHSFREFHRRGERRVGLGVDSENATGATQLYESVGMVTDTEQVVWEKLLA
ncbi:MAG TPA: GNAT family N-acetyltransferase [Gaiellaceae bacterium]|nr:GNAT family N-acetyltransferase [Gaiellaceae bacterium]